MEAVVETINQLEQGVEDVEGLLELAVEEEDQETFDEIEPELAELESKLGKEPEMLSAIGQRLGQLERQLEHYDDVMHENVVAGISGMYQDTLSKLPFRIQVHGDSRFLQQPHIAHQVRAVLMAGIRAAMLWRQVGGKRWHLIFKRKALIKQLEGRF